MRYLRRQSLNRRGLTDRSVSVDLSGEIIMDRPYTLQLPTGTTVDRSPDTTEPTPGTIIPGTYVDGMIRYNSETAEFEGRQAGAWRSFRFKEPTAIVRQYLGQGDDFETTFGPLTPDPFTYTAASEVLTWDAEQMAQNLLVVNETIWQIGGTGYDFTVVQNPPGVHPPGSVLDGDPYDPGTYIKFTIAIALNRPVYVYHNIGN